ncbi:unnamed protein product [Arctia plantaginis]|uniref:Uncharacterized protein n=1 Tax=Arctia plantaginis TaxID=874455 RepID=A0A8S1BAN3_ARCPL|nr:unnamed protein product [Arctia plantaginis]
MGAVVAELAGGAAATGGYGTAGALEAPAAECRAGCALQPVPGGRHPDSVGGPAAPGDRSGAMRRASASQRSRLLYRNR